MIGYCVASYRAANKTV